MTSPKANGHRDRQRRRTLLAMLSPGQQCPLCPEPMWPTQELDVDHVTPRVLGGLDGPVRLAHAECNRRHGGQLGNARMRANAAAGSGPPPPFGTYRDLPDGRVEQWAAHGWAPASRRW